MSSRRSSTSVAADAERVVDGRHEDAAHQVDHADLDAVGRRERPPAAAGQARRIVRGPQDAVGLVQLAAELALVPDVVAAGDEVDAGREHRLGGLRGQAEAARRVLAVGDHRVDVVLLPRELEMLLENLAARRTHDVADDKDGDGAGCYGSGPGFRAFASVDEVDEDALLFTEAHQPLALRRVAQRVERDVDLLVARGRVVVERSRRRAVAHQPVAVLVGEDRHEQLELFARRTTPRRA